MLKKLLIKIYHFHSAQLFTTIISWKMLLERVCFLCVLFLFIKKQETKTSSITCADQTSFGFSQKGSSEECCNCTVQKQKSWQTPTSVWSLVTLVSRNSSDADIFRSGISGCNSLELHGTAAAWRISELVSVLQHSLLLCLPKTH